MKTHLVGCLALMVVVVWPSVGIAQAGRSIQNALFSMDKKVRERAVIALGRIRAAAGNSSNLVAARLSDSSVANEAHRRVENEKRK